MEGESCPTMVVRLRGGGWTEKQLSALGYALNDACGPMISEERVISIYYSGHEELVDFKK